MKKIDSNLTLLQRLKNAEHFDLMDAVHDEVKQHKDSIEGISTVWNTFYAAFLKEDELYKISLKLEGTSEVKAADEKRDATFLELKREIEYRQYSKTEEEKAAADRLKHVLNNYKQANTAAYAENSAMLTNLIQDLRAPEYTQPVSRLGLSALVDRLEAENNAFKAVYRGRSKEDYLHRQESLSNARAVTDKAFLALTDALNAIYLSNELREKDETVRQTLGGLIDAINSYLLQSEKVYARRVPSYKTTKTGEEGTEEGTDPPVPGEVPRFRMKNPVVSGDPHPNFGDSVGNKWSVEAEDPEAFSAVVYPDAAGGTVYFDGQEEVPAFPVAGFLTADDGVQVNGIIMDQAEGGRNWYIRPFRGSPANPPRLIVDGVTIAILEGVEYPDNMGIE